MDVHCSNFAIRGYPLFSESPQMCIAPVARSRRSRLAFVALQRRSWHLTQRQVRFTRGEVECSCAAKMVTLLTSMLIQWSYPDKCWKPNVIHHPENGQNYNVHGLD